MKPCQPPRALLFACACICIQGPLARAITTALPLRSDVTTGIFHGLVSRTISTTFGSSVFEDAFQTNGTITYDFYSPPLTSPTTVESTDKAGGVLWMKNLGTLNASDFRVTGQITFYDYDPASGNQTLILSSDTSLPQTVPHNGTKQFTVPPTAQLAAAYTVVAGHLLKASVTIAYVDGNPAPDGEFLYNGPPGQIGDSVAWLAQLPSRTWTFGNPTGPYVTFSAGTAAGGTAMTAANQITVNYTKNGSGVSASVWDGNSVTDAADLGSTVTFSAASSASTTTERWQANAAATSPSFTVTSSSATFPVTYYDQLKLRVDGSPVAHDTPGSDGTAFGSAVSSGGTSVFYDRGSTAHATLQAGLVVESGIAYTFSSWSGDASGTGLTSGNITMNAAKTATANWLTDAADPVTSDLSVAPVHATPPTVTATVSDASTGGSFVDAAEFFIDAIGADGAGTAMGPADGAFNSSIETVTNTLSQAAFDALAQCAHTIYVHGKDKAGNWGPTSSAVFTKDTVAPAVPTIPDATGYAPLTVTPPTTTDNCAGTVTGTTTDPLTYNTPGTFIVHWTFSDGHGNTSTGNQTVIVNAPLPVLVPPVLDRSVATILATATEFLYTGTNAVQTGVAPGTVEPKRAAVMRGRVLKTDGAVLPGVLISVLNHPEFGYTLTRADGMFDLAVNGGGLLVVACSKDGYLAVQRQAHVPWQEYTRLPDVVMTPLDNQVTSIDVSGGGATQVARGNPVTDADGPRQATVLFPAGNTATMRLPDGTEQPLTTLSVRATEYTVGTNGPAAMPAALPPSSGYTYCVELSADEALAAGATSVVFAQPVYSYVENFLGFPVGTPVPAGYYDRDRGQWIPSQNGRIIKVLSSGGGVADLDVDGSGTPADAAALAALGITSPERIQLAVLYSPGQSVWRVPITHFTPWDLNWAYGPPADGESPNQRKPEVEREIDDPCKKFGSIIELQNQVLREAVGIVGTPFSLNYSSARVPGRKAGKEIPISLSGASVPSSLKRIELEIEVSGQLHRQTFASASNLATTYVWDERDAYGRIVQGQQTATVRIGYVYPTVYQSVSGSSTQAFGALSGVPMGVTTDPQSPRETTTWQQFHELVGSWDGSAVGLGAWSLSVHHVYDPYGLVLHLGDGTRRNARSVANVIAPFAGGGQGGVSEDGIPATQAEFSLATGMAAAPDGSLYICDWGVLESGGSRQTALSIRSRGTETMDTMATAAQPWQRSLEGQLM